MDGFLLARDSNGGELEAMKIYLLLSLIGLIIAFSHIPVPVRSRAKKAAPVPSDSLPA